MSVDLVVDASVLTSAVLQTDAVGAACAALLAEHTLLAPALLPFEVANAIRGQALRGLAPADMCRTALVTALRIPIELHPIDGLSDRVWELRATVSAYDASYVALAEVSGLRLATLDRRLARAPGIRCATVVPG